MENCKDIIRFTKAGKAFREDEKSRNRVESRVVSVFSDQGGFIADGQWSGFVKSVISVERVTQTFNTKGKCYEPRREDAVYLANQVVEAEVAYRRIRHHWFIENKNHHVRDATMDEDASRIRVNPEVMAILRSFALNVLRKNKVSNISQELYENALDYNRLYSYQQFI